MDESHETHGANIVALAPPAGQVIEMIRGHALSLLIGGGICLYFGLSLIATAPGSASKADAEHWFALDNALFWCLRGVGVLLLLAAGVAAFGKRAALLLAALGEVGFTLLMVGMGIVWTMKARADNDWDYQVILLLILAVIGASGAMRVWQTYCRSGAASAQTRVKLDRENRTERNE